MSVSACAGRLVQAGCRTRPEEYHCRHRRHFGYLTLLFAALCFYAVRIECAAEANLEDFCKEGEMKAGLISLAAGTDHESSRLLRLVSSEETSALPPSANKAKLFAESPPTEIRTLSYFSAGVCSKNSCLSRLSTWSRVLDS